MSSLYLLISAITELSHYECFSKNFFSRGDCSLYASFLQLLWWVHWLPTGETILNTESGSAWSQWLIMWIHTAHALIVGMNNMRLRNAAVWCFPRSTSHYVQKNGVVIPFEHEKLSISLVLERTTLLFLRLFVSIIAFASSTVRLTRICPCCYNITISQVW